MVGARGDVAAHQGDGGTLLPGRTVAGRAAPAREHHRALGSVKTGLARRFALWLIARAGTDATRAVYVFMIGTGAISMVVSDVPAAAIFMAIAVGILDKLGLRPGSRFGRAVMIGIPIAALIGRRRHAGRQLHQPARPRHDSRRLPASNLAPESLPLTWSRRPFAPRDSNSASASANPSMKRLCGSR